MRSLNEDTMKPLLLFNNVSAEYGSIKALRELNLVINSGEIHAIVGEHGAGKSTLGKIAANLIKPSSGKLLLDGMPFALKGIKGAMDAGIRMVFQKIQLNDGISVADNLFLNQRQFFKSPFQSYSHKRIEELAEKFFVENGIDLDPACQVSRLELSDKALLAIVRNLYTQPRLLILDEALEKLSSTGLEIVIKWLKVLKSKGTAVLFITHRIDDLYLIADRVSVIRRGDVLISDDIAELDKINLIKLAYTQFSSLDKKNRQADEFNKLLKYNNAVLKELPIGLLVINYDNNIKLMNKSARNMFGYNDFPRLRIDELLKGNEEILSLIKQTSDELEMKSLNDIPLNVCGKSYKTDIIVYPIIEDNNLIGNMLIIEDVTEREKLREQLILSEKLAGIGLLAAGIAHEINNPLGVICNYLESFKQNKISEQNREEVIAYLFEQVEYITNVISNLIVFCDNNEKLTESVELNHEVERIIRLIRFNGNNRNIKINFRSKYSEVFAKINKNDFKQIILNLFKNSFEAMTNGGEIFIIIDTVNTNGDNKIRVLFSDTGPGIKHEDPNDIFLPFKTSKNSNDNFGLGLSLCFNLLKRYSGKISVRNLTQGGCEFEILLPQI